MLAQSTVNLMAKDVYLQAVFFFLNLVDNTKIMPEKLQEFDIGEGASMGRPMNVQDTLDGKELLLEKSRVRNRVNRTGWWL